MHMDSYWYILIDLDTQFISPVQNTHVHLWVFSCALRGFGALIGLIPQANFSGLCNSLTLHVAAMTGKCLARFLQLEVKPQNGDGKDQKENLGTTRRPNPGRLGNSLDIYTVTNMSQEKLLLAEHFATQLGNFCTSTSAIWSAVIEDRPCHRAIGHQSHHCPYAIHQTHKLDRWVLFVGGIHVEEAQFISIQISIHSVPIQHPISTIL